MSAVPSMPLSAAARVLEVNRLRLHELIDSGTLPLYQRRGRDVLLTEDVVGYLNGTHGGQVEVVVRRSEVFMPGDKLNFKLPHGHWFAAIHENVSREQFDYVIEADGWKEVPKIAIDALSAERTAALHAIRDAEGNVPDRLAVFDFVFNSLFFARKRETVENVSVLLRLAAPI